jgi:hypothetical protein
MLTAGNIHRMIASPKAYIVLPNPGPTSDDYDDPLKFSKAGVHTICNLRQPL